MTRVHLVRIVLGLLFWRVHGSRFSSGAARQLLQGATTWNPHASKTVDLREIARSEFQYKSGSYGEPTFDRHGNQSLFEQVRKLFSSKASWPQNWDAWLANWSADWDLVVSFKDEAGQDSGGVRREWSSLVLESIVLPEKGYREGLMCLTLGHCTNATRPQYLLEPLPSGDVIPVMGVKHEVGSTDLRQSNLLRFWMDTARDVAEELKYEADKAGYLRTGVAKLYEIARQETSQTIQQGPVGLWMSRARAVLSKVRAEADREQLLSFWLSSAYEVAMGIQDNESALLPQEALESFNFLGQWIARAYVIAGLSYSPASFHPLIYESLLNGKVKPPKKVPTFYNISDTIKECEWLAAVHGRRSPQELETYGWTSCSEVKDPVSRRYVQEGCYVPIYRDQATWDVLFTEWGAFAPEDAKADDTVPFERAREYTQLQCRHAWRKGFVSPVTEIVAGFRKVLPSEYFWKKVGNASTLKALIEGSPDIDLDAMVSAANFTDFTPDEQNVVLGILRDLREDGTDLQPLQKPLNKLVRFFTGSFKAPVVGWKNAPPIFQKKMQESGDKCAPLIGKTCFNKLYIPANCLKDSSQLKDVILESIASEDFGLE
mmetsp:Transcript_40407/g.93762  ORF Transcript_40407/g.93762 Transcript_40407/m.93762 type:complete len:602 (+) Transcript_40407:37-1842(+)